MWNQCGGSNSPNPQESNYMLHACEQTGKLASRAPARNLNQPTGILSGALVLPAATAKDFLAWLTALVSFGLLLGPGLCTWRNSRLNFVGHKGVFLVTHDMWRFLNSWDPKSSKTDRF